MSTQQLPSKSGTQASPSPSPIAAPSSSRIQPPSKFTSVSHRQLKVSLQRHVTPLDVRLPYPCASQMKSASQIVHRLIQEASASQIVSQMFEQVIPSSQSFHRILNRRSTDDISITDVSQMFHRSVNRLFHRFFTEIIN